MAKKFASLNKGGVVELLDSAPAVDTASNYIRFLEVEATDAQAIIQAESELNQFFAGNAGGEA